MMSDVFDNIVISLCKFTNLLNQSDVNIYINIFKKIFSLFEFWTIYGHFKDQELNKKNGRFILLIFNVI